MKSNEIFERLHEIAKISKFTMMEEVIRMYERLDVNEGYKRSIEFLKTSQQELEEAWSYGGMAGDCFGYSAEVDMLLANMLISIFSRLRENNEYDFPDLKVVDFFSGAKYLYEWLLNIRKNSTISLESEFRPNIQVYIKVTPFYRPDSFLPAFLRAGVYNKKPFLPATIKGHVTLRDGKGNYLTEDSVSLILYDYYKDVPTKTYNLGLINGEKHFKIRIDKKGTYRIETDLKGYANIPEHFIVI
jgi:hypothetical protein